MMKNKKDLSSSMPSILACLALSASVCIGKPVITVNTYDSNINGVWDWYGGSTLSWDSSQDHTGDGGGSLYIQKNTSNDHIFDVQSFSGNQWDNGTAYDLTLYTNLSLWIKWDTNSTMSISDFNANLGGLTMELNDNHLGQYDWSGNGLHILPSVLIPNAASNGWVHLNFPVSATIPYIDTIGSIIFDAYHTTPWSGTVQFWVDDITFQPAAVDVVPPPVIQPITKATPGLNVFASTESSLYDRQSAVLRQTSGLSWVGQATPANPVTYSFTIAGYPKSVNCEAWLFLIPNPAYLDNAPDWNETNVALIYLQGSLTNATMHFQYKVNEDHQQAMYSGGSETRSDGATFTNNYIYSAAPGSLPGGPITNALSPGVYNITNESGNLASVVNNSILGTWTIKFTSDTSGTLIAPNGNSTNFTMPIYNTTNNFSEQDIPGFYVYLGMQANNADALNQAVVYSNFAISNTAAPFYENFLTDSVLDTTNIWNTSAASGPLGVFVAPAGSSSWVTWTLPDAGFSLQVAPTLTNPFGWTSPSIGPRLAMLGVRSQLVATSEIPAGPTAFFDLVKRTATQLQVLLPGETNAPNTLTGKVGTPTSFTTSDAVPVTINMVDSTFHIVNSNDSLQLSSTDGGGNFGFSTATPSLSGGTVTVTAYFDSGSWTVTAADTTTLTITSGTSSSITIQ